MAIHPQILHNGQIRPAASAEFRAGQIGLLAGWGVFTTLRIAEGLPFAWERHWARLSRDARLLNLAMPSDSEAVERDLLRLIDANGQQNCTLRLVIVRNAGGMWEDAASKERPVDLIAMTADSKKWGSSVRLGLQPTARFAGNEFAGAKILSWGHNLTWAERAQQQGLDEVVLLNQYDRVTECTSANIFAVFGKDVLTPPVGDGCLPGITREVLLNAIRAEDIRVSEGPLTVDDLYRAEAVFITSTTRDLVAVREVGGRVVGDSDTVRQKLAAAFQTFLKADIERRKSARVLA